MLMLDPQSVPQVKIDFMNEDHQEAIELINQIAPALAAADQARISDLLQQFYQHNLEHFAREEAEMQRINFPPYECHKGEHDRVLAELRQAIQQWQETSDTEALGRYLKETVKPWFINHVGTMDRVTAHFIQTHSAE